MVDGALAYFRYPIEFGQKDKKGHVPEILLLCQKYYYDKKILLLSLSQITSLQLLVTEPAAWRCGATSIDGNGNGAPAVVSGAVELVHFTHRLYIFYTIVPTKEKHVMPVQQTKNVIQYKKQSFDNTYKLLIQVWLPMICLRVTH